MRKRTPWWGLLIGALWCLFVILDYWYKHPLYEQALKGVHLLMVIVHLAIGSMYVVLARRCMIRWQLLLLTAATFFMMVVIPFVVSGFLRLEEVLGLGAIFSFSGRTALQLVFILGFLISSYTFGYLVMTMLRLPARIASLNTIRLAVGLSLMMILFMMALVAGGFAAWVFWTAVMFPIVVFLVVRRFRNARIDLLTWLSSAQEQWGWLGYGALAGVVILTTMCYIHCLSPMPVGFDAMNYYINLPRLINDTGALMPGFQPYYWSLLQAGAMKMTGLPSMALQFAWLGLPLMQLAMYELGRRVLGFHSDWMMVAVLFMTAMPTVLTQASQELKIDLAFNFIMMAVLMVMLQYVESRKEVQHSKDMPVIVLIGLLSGVGLGIKLTGIIVFACVMAIFWAHRHRALAGAGMLLAALGAFLIVGLDQVSGMRAYHASVDWMPYVLIGAGCFLMLFSMKDEMRRAFRTILLSGMMALCMVVTFSPWLIKNALEIEHPTPMRLLRGDATGPQLNLKKIDRQMKSLEE